MKGRRSLEHPPLPRQLREALLQAPTRAKPGVEGAVRRNDVWQPAAPRLARGDELRIQVERVNVDDVSAAELGSERISKRRRVDETKRPARREDAHIESRRRLDELLRRHRSSVPANGWVGHVRCEHGRLDAPGTEHPRKLGRSDRRPTGTGSERRNDMENSHVSGRLPLPPGGAGLRGRLTPLGAGSCAGGAWPYWVVLSCAPPA
jgi:hypothetical protein